MDQQRILQIILDLGILVFSLSLHEFGHAFMANRLGDPTAKMLGRLTMDPRAHADPIGTILIPLLRFIYPNLLLFGWAKPVPVTPENFQNPKRDGALVALAGPMANFFLCVVCMALLSLLDLTQFMGLDPGGQQLLLIFFRSFFWLNFALAVFNLIPLYPLDGSWIMKYILPGHWSYAYSQMDRYSGIALLAFFYLGWLNKIFVPLERGLFMLMGTFGLNRLTAMIFS